MSTNIISHIYKCTIVYAVVMSTFSQRDATTVSVYIHRVYSPPTVLLLNSHVTVSVCIMSRVVCCRMLRRQSKRSRPAGWSIQHHQLRSISSLCYLLHGQGLRPFKSLESLWPNFIARPGLRPGLIPGCEQKEVAAQVSDFFSTQNLISDGQTWS